MIFKYDNPLSYLCPPDRYTPPHAIFETMRGLFRSRLARMRLLTAALAALLPLNVVAGGSFEPVMVESLTVSQGTDYTLVVRPQSSAAGTGWKDPYMGDCPKFTVHGTYSWFHSRSFSKHVTRENHRAALEHLRLAQREKTTVNFGWMGTGFIPVSRETPCIVRSRALELNAWRGRIGIMSYYNPV